VPADAPPFLGGLVGFLGYDLGAVLERLPALAPPTRTCRRSGSRSTTGSSPGTGATGHAWLGGRALDGTTAGSRRARRRPCAADRAGRAGRVVGPRWPPLEFRSGLDRAAYEAGVERIREHIASGDIYQANLTRRLETPFDGDPWASTGGFGPATRRCSRRTSTSVAGS
jgi:para-aminobenzoate synthetase component 1